MQPFWSAICIDGVNLKEILGETPSRQFLKSYLISLNYIWCSCNTLERPEGAVEFFKFSSLLMSFFLLHFLGLFSSCNQASSTSFYDQFHWAVEMHLEEDTFTLLRERFVMPCAYCNISLVMELQRWQSKIFGQESKWNCFSKILRWINVHQKVSKLYFQSQFSMSKIFF